jgi:plasmid replication initiation protein
VLEPSIKQINEHTDITVTYEQHKKGRIISGFSFKFKQKQQPKVESKEIQTRLIFYKNDRCTTPFICNKMSEMPEMGNIHKVQKATNNLLFVSLICF